jgi:uncharacterized membrane protein YedE/YeeE
LGVRVKCARQRGLGFGLGLGLGQLCPTTTSWFAIGLVFLLR